MKQILTNKNFTFNSSAIKNILVYFKNTVSNKAF